MSANIDLWFPTPIYRANDIISEDYKQELIEESYRLKSEIPDQSYKWNCEIYTTYGHQLSQYQKFKNLINNITDHVCRFAKELGSDSSDYTPTGAWINIASKGHFQEHHRHNGAIFSAVYYLQAPEGAGNLVFESPIGFTNGLKNVNNEATFYTQEHVKYPPIENSLIVFRSHMQHMVQMCENEKDRISVAINYT